MVRREAEIVLGEDNDAAWRYLRENRRKVIGQYKENMRVIREIEKARYGENSFFRLCEQGLFREPRYEGDYVNLDSGEGEQNNGNNDDSGDMAMSDAE